MKITAIETKILKIKGEIELKSDGTQDALIVLVHTDEGITGVGEVDSSPYVVKAAIEAPTSHSVCRGLREVLIGQNPLNIETLWDKMYAASNWFGLRGVAIHAMSGIDIALYDILGKVTEQPIYRLLGGAYHDKFRAYASTLFPDTEDEVKRIVEEAISNGFTALKLGWGKFGQDEKHDLKLIKAARQTGGDNFDIMVDAGLCYKNVYSAISMAKRLEEHNIFWFEEPLSSDDVEGYALLAEASNVRIAAGERLETRYAFKDLVEKTKVDVLQPDVTRAGGFTECKKISLLADFNSRWMVPHGWSTDILLSAVLHLNASLPKEPLLEFCIQDSPLRTGLVRESFKLEDGYVAVPEKPGLGIELNEEAIKEYRIS
jgi:L-alanine-DL-glutamate epimerase-like enolase superfamily enzyme